MRWTDPVDFMKAIHVELANKTGKLWSVEVSIDKGLMGGDERCCA
jgi:hypothetical protein